MRIKGLAAAAFATVVASCAVAPTEEGAGATSAVSRDLSGVWQVMNVANYNLEAHPASHAMQLRQGPWGMLPAKSVVKLGAVGAVPSGESMIKGGGDIPYTPEALKTRDANKADWINRDPEVKCYQPGVPRATYMPYPFQIIQNDGAMLIVYEYANTVRNIELTDPGEAPLDSWMGQSYGYWDDDSFVIEVTAQNGQTWLDRSGNFASNMATVTERYTRIGQDHMRYEATIEDPETYTQPWTISMMLYRKVGEDAQLHEFNCVEFVEEMLYGHLRKEPLK